MRRLLVLAAFAVLGAACRNEGPTAGELAVRLDAPRPTERGIQFEVVGRAHGVAVPPGSAYQVFADSSSDGDTTYVIVVAPASSGLLAGDLARIRVSDNRSVAGYSVRALALANSQYGADTTLGVVLRVVRP